MSLELVKELIKELENSSLSVLECEFGGAKVKLQRGGSFEMAPYIAQNVHSKSIKSESEISDHGNVKILSGKIITSPMVGTFYAAPAPDKDPYVSAGQSIKKGDIVCIIEAMKLMNEIESEEDGIITEILVKNGDMVEYGEPLFVMK